MYCASDYYVQGLKYLSNFRLVANSVLKARHVLRTMFRQRQLSINDHSLPIRTFPLVKIANEAKNAIRSI
jgi:hypothetical protein